MASTSKPEGQARLSDEEKRKEYVEFEAKVKRTIYIEHLSPQVTEAVVKAALGQVGRVENVDFLPNQVMPFANLAQAALVEMESEKKAEAVVATLCDFPFMMSGMPRPVQAKRAWSELFPNRPTRPGKKPIEFRWVEPRHPGSENIKRLELIAKRHQAERIALIKAHLEMEEKLAEQEQEALTTDYKKYEIIDKSMHDGTIPKLASCYDVSLAEEI